MYEVVIIAKQLSTNKNLFFFIKNYIYFTKTIDRLILIHVYTKLYDTCVDENIINMCKNNNIILLKSSRGATKFSQYSATTLINSLFYMQNNNITSKYILCMTDSEIFINNLTISKITTLLNHNCSSSISNDWFWKKKLEACNKLTAYFTENKISTKYQQYNGLVFECNMLNRIVNILLDLTLLNIFNELGQFPIDELLWASLLNHVGSKTCTLCKVYWANTDDNKMINNINNKDIIIKPSNDKLNAYVEKNIMI
jgi:hypothetical protein